MSLLSTYKNLEQCVVALEESYEKNVKDFLSLKTISQTDLELDSKLNHHYQEIFRHLKEIKTHLIAIAEHDSDLNSLLKKGNDDEKRNSIVDKNYIKKQIETFQNLQNVEVHKREHKTKRPPETSSQYYLESWEKFLQNQEEELSNLTSNGVDVTIKKRQNALRKNKKIISSTIDTLLDNQNLVENSLDCVLEDEEAAETINPAIINVSNEMERENSNKVADTKPRIIGMIPKKNPNI